MRHFGSAILMIAAMITSCPMAPSQDAIALKPEPLVNRFYDITLLVEPRQQFPFGGRPENPFQGGGGFGGGGGGMGGGGGGFFSLPLEPVQFGGGGLGSGGPGGGTAETGIGYSGGSYASNDQVTEPSLKEELENSGGQTIPDLIQNFIAPDTWSDNEGPVEIHDLGHTLLIRQTEKVHSEIEQFLKELTTAAIGKGTYQLEAWWIPTSDVGRLQLKDTLSVETDDIDKAENITTLCESLGGFHGTLLCRERVTSNTASGKQVPVVAGSIPVVGTGTSGDQPIVKILHIGLMLEARLSPVPGYLASAKDEKPVEQIELHFRSSITNRDAQAQQLPPDAKIDRYSLGQHAAAGSCRLKLGKPTLIASLSELSSAKANDAGGTPELLMVVRVTRLEN